MKSKKFPDTLYVTFDNDGEEFYPLCWEAVPDQDGDKVAEYKLVRKGTIKVVTPKIEWCD